MEQRSRSERDFWAQFDALEMGSGWDDQDILKPQILVESVFGDSLPGSTHLNQLMEQACIGVYEKGGKPAGKKQENTGRAGGMPEDGCMDPPKKEPRPGCGKPRRQERTVGPRASEQPQEKLLP